MADLAEVKKSVEAGKWGKTRQDADHIYSELDKIIGPEKVTPELPLTAKEQALVTSWFGLGCKKEQLDHAVVLETKGDMMATRGYFSEAENLYEQEHAFLRQSFLLKNENLLVPGNLQKLIRMEKVQFKLQEARDHQAELIRYERQNMPTYAFVFRDLVGLQDLEKRLGNSNQVQRIQNTLEAMLEN